MDSGSKMDKSMKTLPRLLAVGLLVLAAMVARLGLAGEPSETPAGEEASKARVLPSSSSAPVGWSEEGPSFPWVRLVCGTAAVGAIVCFGVWGLKWLNGGSPLNRGRYMEVLESRPIGHKVQLFLIKVGGRIVLLACRGENVASLAQFEEGELPQPEQAAGQRAGARFKSLFQHVLKGQQ